MLSDAEIAKMSNKVAERFDAINTEYIKRMGEHIREIGELSPTDLHRLEQMQRLQMNTREINSMLIRETGLALSDLQKVYEKSGMCVYGDSLKYYAANGVKQVPFASNKAIQSYMASQAKLTRNTFANLARTTNISKTYKKVMDQAIQAVSSGVTDYKSAMRSAMRKAAKSGMRVTYKSGVTRRLDSAVRMNVLEGIRQVNMGIRDIAGKEFGADGVELSAHALCATDHMPYQGLQYTNAEFEDLNGDLVRKIGTCNCHHYTFPILIGVSSRTYSDEELQHFKEYSSEVIDIDGKKISRYEASQYMRKLETNMRYAKDEITMAKACGDKVMERRAKDRLRIMQGEYRKVGGNAGLQLQYERARVSAMKQAKRAGLGSGGSDGIIKPHDNPILLKKIDYTDKAAVEKELKLFEKDAIKEDIETAIVITRDGEVYKCFGVPDSVYPDSDLGEKFKGATVSHNHVSKYTQYTFGKDDLSSFEKWNLDRLRGIDHKYTYEYNREYLIDNPPRDWMNLENYQHCFNIKEATERKIGYRRWLNDRGTS